MLLFPGDFFLLVQLCHVVPSLEMNSASKSVEDVFLLED